MLPSDTLVREGRGRLTRPTGMSWSAFRPSDDATELGFNVPGNMFASVVLGYLQEIAAEVLDDEPLAARAKELKADIDDGIARHGTVEHPKHGHVYAYEVDGAGATLLMDDANMPSLLGIPLTGYAAADDPTYVATRELLLSPENPYYYSGTHAAGIGSPHTPPHQVWPIALAVQGLTSTSAEERQRLLELLRDTTGGTGLMHESLPRRRSDRLHPRVVLLGERDVLRARPGPRRDQVTSRRRVSRPRVRRRSRSRPARSAGHARRRPHRELQAVRRWRPCRSR